MEPSPDGARRRWPAVVGVLLVLVVAVVAVMSIEAPSGSRQSLGAELSGVREPDSEPEPEPEPVRVVAEPPSVPAGTDVVGVTVGCRTARIAVVVSDAFEYAQLAQPLAAGGVSGEVELDPDVTPGRYPLIAKCGDGEQFGRGELVITKGKAAEPPGPRRVATTSVTLAPAEPGAWRDHPEAAAANMDERTPGAVVFELKVTHELRVPADDPDVAAVRAGAAGHAPTKFAENRLGLLGPEEGSGAMTIDFGAPVIRMERGSREALITFTGVAYGTSTRDPEDYVGIEFFPPSSEDALPLTAHEIVFSATGWTVAGASGPSPLAQDAHYLRLSGKSEAKVAFTRDGSVGAVAGFLAGDSEIGAYIDGRFPEGDEPEAEPPAGFLAKVWMALRLMLGAAAVLMLLHHLVHALGAAWWRRRRNQVLAAVVAVAMMVPVVVGYTGDAYGWLGPLLFALLLAVLPVMALRSAARAVGGRGRMPAVAGRTAAALAGATLSVWGLGQLAGLWPAFCWVLVAAALAVAASALRRQWLPGVVLLMAASGVLLGGRALGSGLFPDTGVWAALLAISWFVVAFGWVSEAADRWSPRTAITCAMIVPATIGILTYALSPAPLGQGHVQIELLTLVLFGLPVLALTTLVVRVRRIGGTPRGLAAPAAFHTAVLVVLVLHTHSIVNPHFFGITLLLAWTGLMWLLPASAAAGHAVRAAVSAEEHRLLVRDMIRRRSVRAALTELLRRREAGEDFEERRAALERAADHWSGPIDSDLALATLAGRTPWQNGLAALGVGAVLSLPFSAVRISESISGGQTAAGEVLIAAMAVLSLPVLCMVFGYFYPRVRGTNPIAKSLAFLVAALLIELPAYVPTLVVAATEDANLAETPLPTTGEALIGVLVAVGNIAVVSIGLGLWWEWRLMALAGEPWARVRNVRTLRALAAPLAAVSIAIATTAATALVNNVVAPLPTAPAPEPPATSTSGR